MFPQRGRRLDSPLTRRGTGYERTNVSQAVELKKKFKGEKNKIKKKKKQTTSFSVHRKCLTVNK